jgi:hypothetical protein
MSFVRNALMTTVVVLAVIFISRKVPVVGMWVDRALVG